MKHHIKGDHKNISNTFLTSSLSKYLIFSLYFKNHFNDNFFLFINLFGLVGTSPKFSFT